MGFQPNARGLYALRYLSAIRNERVNCGLGIPIFIRSSGQQFGMWYVLKLLTNDLIKKYHTIIIPSTWSPFSSENQPTWKVFRFEDYSKLSIAFSPPPLVQLYGTCTMSSTSSSEVFKCTRTHNRARGRATERGAAVWTRESSMRISSMNANTRKHKK